MTNLPADQIGSPSALELRYDPMSRDELIAECERLRVKAGERKRQWELEPPHCATCACTSDVPACASNCASRKTDPYGFPYACDCTLTR